MSWNLNLATGGAPPLDYDEAKRIAKRVVDENRARSASGGNSEQKPAAWTDRAVYSAAYNATTNVPTDGSVEGVETMHGRVWAEARSVVHSGGAGAVEVTLIASQNGVRAGVRCPAGTTLTSASIRYWLQDPMTKQWGLGGVDEALAAGVRTVWGTDQFTTVGAR